MPILTEALDETGILQEELDKDGGEMFQRKNTGWDM